MALTTKTTKTTKIPLAEAKPAEAKPVEKPKPAQKPKPVEPEPEPVREVQSMPDGSIQLRLQKGPVTLTEAQARAIAVLVKK